MKAKAGLLGLCRRCRARRITSVADCGRWVRTSKKQDWTATEQTFRRFLQWLDEGKDSNGQRYLEMRKRLVRYFDQKQCSSADDLADETLDRARRLEEQGSITDTTPPRC